MGVRPLCSQYYDHFWAWRVNLPMVHNFAINVPKEVSLDHRCTDVGHIHEVTVQLTLLCVYRSFGPLKQES